MKIGLGLYRRMLTPENFRFARQCGCTHIVAHLVDYFQGGQLHGTDENTCWGVTPNRGKLWTEQELLDLVRSAAGEGLEIAAIENFDPAHWYDVLLDGPNKREQLEDLKTIIRRLGKVGIPVMGYNFSLASVWGHVVGPWARGGASSVAFRGPQGPKETPIPRGQVWNMIYDPDAPPGHIPPTTHEQLWDRVAEFLDELVPVAEEAGVRLAAHPDDPPMPTLRGTPRLVYQPHLYQRLLDLAPSPSNALEFCLGTIAEMSEGDVYEATQQYASQGAIAYVHFRNIRGKVPNYEEVFIDEGDIDMLRVLRILRDCEYDGVLIPDHTPSLDCDAPWHAGMAYALGYLQAALRAVDT
ncbi:MAG: mannonate dehydratase [Planctomycetes bacterium]|nr:mannonate dehydratase [Planctomycetota bacterium]